MTDFSTVQAALSELKIAVDVLSAAIDQRVSADSALQIAQAGAVVAAQTVIDADTAADVAMGNLVAALEAIGVSPVPMV